MSDTTENEAKNEEIADRDSNIWKDDYWNLLLCIGLTQKIVDKRNGNVYTCYYESNKATYYSFGLLPIFA